MLLQQSLEALVDLNKVNNCNLKSNFYHTSLDKDESVKKMTD